MLLCPSARAVALVVLFSAGAAASWISCCSMTREQLENIIGRNDACPKTLLGLRVGDVLEKKCSSCPVGTCRIGNSCYCPKGFLEIYERERENPKISELSLPGKCAVTHAGKMWPESVEMGDHAWRGCGEDVTLTDFGTKSCCALTEEELLAASGTSKFCPNRLSTLSRLDEKCETCPAGTCCNSAVRSFNSCANELTTCTRAHMIRISLAFAKT